MDTNSGAARESHRAKGWQARTRRVVIVALVFATAFAAFGFERAIVHPYIVKVARVEAWQRNKPIEKEAKAYEATPQFRAWFARCRKADRDDPYGFNCTDPQALEFAAEQLQNLADAVPVWDREHPILGLPDEGAMFVSSTAASLWNGRRGLFRFLALPLKLALALGFGIALAGWLLKKWT